MLKSAHKIKRISHNKCELVKHIVCKKLPRWSSQGNFMNAKFICRVKLTFWG